MSSEILPFLLSFAPSRSMYRLGGAVGMSLRVISMVDSSVVVEMRVMVDMAVWIRTCNSRSQLGLISSTEIHQGDSR